MVIVKRSLGLGEGALIGPVSKSSPKEQKPLASLHKEIVEALGKKAKIEMAAQMRPRRKTEDQLSPSDNAGPSEYEE